MRIHVLAGALVVALGTAGPARAEAAGQMGAAGASVPTVTIINKSESDTESEPNALSVVEETDAEGVLPSRAVDTEAETEILSEPDEADAANSAADEAAALDEAPPPAPTLHIDVDLTRQVMTVSAEGDVLYSWQVSSGRQGHLTPTGTFTPTWMARSWFSKQYDNAPMPHAIFFHKGVAIHGSWATRSLGRPASHGCVRLAPKNARKLFALVSRHGKDRTEIVVHGAPQFRSPPAVAARERLRRNAVDARRAAPYVYLPPSAAARRGNVRPRVQRRTAQQQRYYAPRQPRGLFTGYGF